MPHVNIKHGYQIGDCLSHVPYLEFLAHRHGEPVQVSGEFNALVWSMLGSYPFSLKKEKEGADYVICMRDMMAAYGQGNLHMCQTFFEAAAEPVPVLPLKLDLLCRPCGLPPGIVMAPYSHSDLNNNKLWEVSRWIEVSRALPLDVPRYVVGTVKEDDAAPFVRAGFAPVFDRPLEEVLDLLRRSVLFLSIDNGLSHLAHYGDVKRHVLLYPACFSEYWATNPRASVVRGAPSAVQPHQIIEVALRALEKQ